MWCLDILWNCTWFTSTRGTAAWSRPLFSPTAWQSSQCCFVWVVNSQLVVRLLIHRVQRTVWLNALVLCFALRTKQETKKLYFDYDIKDLVSYKEMELNTSFISIWLQKCYNHFVSTIDDHCNIYCVFINFCISEIQSINFKLGW